MQAIIMAAGRGSRLGKLTENNPKSFIEINREKLIDINVKILKKHGVNEIIIVTGYMNEMFEKHFHGIDGIRLIYNPFYEKMNVLGSFYMGQEALSDNFVYLHADTICDISIFERVLSLDADVVLPVDFKECDDEAMKVKITNGKLVSITKEMPKETSDGEFIGIAKFSKNVLGGLKKEVKEILKEKKYMSYFESALQRIIEKNEYDIKIVPTNGEYWCEIDFEEDLEKAVKNFPESLVSL